MPKVTTFSIRPQTGCPMSEEHDEELAQQWYDRKTAVMEQTLGKEHDMVMHAIIEVFRSEMDFARENGGASLLQRLDDAGHYPYSDLDREPVA